jgi:rhamnogalacturonyl hydrolase YesR
MTGDAVKKIETSFGKLKDYCENQQFKGWDPFDGLNSRVFKSLVFLNRNKYFRLLWIQAFKKNPVNLRKPLFVKKDYNPKGLALFLNGYCNLYHARPDEITLNRINELAEKVISSKTTGYSGSCWGYNFDWQSLAFFQPRFTPTIVGTTFAGYALLDAYDITGNKAYLDEAESACNFILKDLNRTYDADGDFAFSYSPLDNTSVFNASLLGARLLSRVYSYTKNMSLIEAAEKAVSFCCKQQNPDGSWYYSPLSFHRWIDNFHTGYNLECIDAFQRYSGNKAFGEYISKGLNYYIDNFFLPTGLPKYYNNNAYPVDVHAPSQLVITLSRLGCIKEHRQLVDKVLEWTIDNMQDKKEGYFYYQKNRWYTIRIPYIRWSQAWMFYALSEYVKKIVSERV